MNNRIIVAASTESHIRRFHLPYIRALRGEGFDVRVMAAGEGADYNVPFEKKIFSPKNLGAVKKIRRAVRGFRPGTVFVHTTLAAFWVRLALLSARDVRVVNVVHGYLFPAARRSFKERLFLLAERMLSRRTDALIVMNAEDEGIAVHYRLSSEIRRVEGFGIEKKTPIGKEEARAAIGIGEEKVILFVGEFSKRKNQQFLIRALPKIREKVPTVLCLVGSGAEENALRDLAKEVGAAPYVRFCGESETPDVYMCAADLYVSASRSEGSPFNVAEALSLGVPTLVSDVKGNSDVMGEELHDHLFSLGDEAEYVNKVCHILTDPSCYPKQRAMERGRHFSLGEVYAETYESMRGQIR